MNRRQRHREAMRVTDMRFLRKILRRRRAFKRWIKSYEQMSQETFVAKMREAAAQMEWRPIEISQR